MIDISVRDLTKAFEVNNNILDGLTFQVQHGERVGILGRNGTGKTTLFRLMVGELTEDKGEIDIARGKRLGLVSQIPHYPAGYTVEDVLATAEERLNAMQARMRKLEELMAVSSDRALLSEYDELLSRFEMLGGYDAEVRRSKVANGLDIPPAMRGQLFDSLSGGEKTRVNLARLILEDTDILLLDEPTNHLDMHATEWLEDYLLHFKGTVLAISHDRWFLDKVAQRIIEIVNGKAEFYNGNYTFYAEEKQRRYEELRICRRRRTICICGRSWARTSCTSARSPWKSASRGSRPPKGRARTKSSPSASGRRNFSATRCLCSRTWRSPTARRSSSPASTSS